MTRISVTPSRIAGVAKREIMRRVKAARLDQTLVSQAKRRIENKGDSTHRYPELWANKIPGHYRSGGSPLRDTGAGYNGLHGETRGKANGVNIQLLTHHLYMVYHQHGFSTKGPTYIPITKRATRFKSTASALEGGMKRGVDFISFKSGVTVPQRKIFNMPPEDKAELAEAVMEVIR